jgi:TfoX/Sxy family transcriptional regulator of competence genes
MTATDPAVLGVRLEQAVGGTLDLRFRAMFGGLSVYSGDKIFATLSDVGIGLKLGEADRLALLREPGAKPLQYDPDQPPSKTYVVLPPQIVADDSELALWVRRSADFVATLPAKAAKRKSQ